MNVLHRFYYDILDIVQHIKLLFVVLIVASYSCRKCGCLICNNCSKNNIKMAKDDSDDDKEVRVCDACIFWISPLYLVHKKYWCLTNTNSLKEEATIKYKYDFSIISYIYPWTCIIYPRPVQPFLKSNKRGFAIICFTLISNIIVIFSSFHHYY